MPKCSKCKSEIKYIEFKYNIVQKGICVVDSDGDIDAPVYETDVLEEAYFCPKCNEKLDIDDPEEFLKGSELNIKDFN